MILKSHVVVAILFGILAAVSSYPWTWRSSNQAEDTLVFTQVFFRHGNRTPELPTFPKDRYLNYSYYPVGMGQLTNGGKLHEYLIGQFLRYRYGKFLGDVLDPDVMLVRSTDVPRAKNSASLVSAGLWPPAPLNQWALGIGCTWNPVPQEVIPLETDNLLYVEAAPCPAYDREFSRVVNSSEVQKLLDSFSEIREFLSTHTGMDVDLPDQGYNIYQALLGQTEFGLELPYWAHAVFPQKMAPFVDLFFVLNAYNEKLQRLRSGRLLHEMIQNNINAAKGKLNPQGRKIILYSAHDTTVSAFLLTLGVYNYLIPPYGITFLMELHRIPGAERDDDLPYFLKDVHRFGVKMFLRNSTLQDPFPLTLPNCDHLCPLDRFMILTSEMVIKNSDDWHTACE